MARFFTFRKNVPKLAGYFASFLRGKGWYEKKGAPDKKPSGAAAVRGRLAVLMDQTVKNAANWHYAIPTDHDGGRTYPMPTEAEAVNGTVHADCSFGCAILCKLAGAQDPTGDNWRGNSSSMFETLEHVQRADLKVGDMVVLGEKGRLHAMMVRSLGSDPTVWSHGQEVGPLYVKLSVEVAYHAQRYTDGGVVTFLRLKP